MTHLLFYTSLFIAYFSFGSCRIILESTHNPALLIVSFDGFKPDYLDKGITPNLNKFRNDGASAEFLKPVFPTKTIVNHFTIATVSKNSHSIHRNVLLYNIYLISNKFIVLIMYQNRASIQRIPAYWPINYLTQN